MSEYTQGGKEEKLTEFIEKYKRGKYRKEIAGLSQINGKSILIDLSELAEYEDGQIGSDISNNSDEVLEQFETAAFKILIEEDKAYAERLSKNSPFGMGSSKPIDFCVRIKDTNEDRHVSIRTIGTQNLDKLVTVPGLVVRASNLQPFLVWGIFSCSTGHSTIIKQEGKALKKPLSCSEPSCGINRDRYFQLDKRSSLFIDYQEIRIQELPEELPAGQLPRAFDVQITGDSVNKIRPGDRVDVTGIIRAEEEDVSKIDKLTTFNAVIESRHIDVIGKEPEDLPLAKEDQDRITELSKDEQLYDKLIQSVAPFIHGHENEKEAILLLLAGSPRKTLADGTKIRGDINILLVGDPGTAKSELLKYVAKIAQRGLYTSGKGSTAAGLTAAVVREKNGGMMFLEAGAVVLADQGVAAVDEFDKMRAEDRSALHETMEQQTVSVAKGGIVATLNARTSIIAAANPTFGRYDIYKNLHENLENIPTPLLTRFDLIFAVRDEKDRVKDEQLARHILDTHRNEDQVTAPPINFELLKKYIIYSKKINPKLTKEAQEKILEYYLATRNIPEEDMVIITPRQLEGLIRLATARSRILLKNKVTEEDALTVISLMKKMFDTVGIDVKTGKPDMVGILQGLPKSDKDKLMTAVEIFSELQGKENNHVKEQEYIDKLVATGRFTEIEAKQMLQKMSKEGQIYEVNKGNYLRT